MKYGGGSALPSTPISRSISCCTAAKIGDGAAWPAGAACAGDSDIRGDLPLADTLATAKSSARIERTVRVSFKRVTPSARIAGHESNQSTLVSGKSKMGPGGLAGAS